MGFRFRKSFKVAPGVKFNLNKKSVGVTFGEKGAHYTINSSGKKTTSVGIPGTGMYYTNSTGGSGASGGGSSSGGNGGTGGSGSGGSVSGGGFSQTPAPRDPFYQRTWFIILSLIFLAPLGIFLMWKFKPWNKIVKGLISIVFGLWFLFWAMIAFGSSLPDTPEDATTTEPVSESQHVEVAARPVETEPLTTESEDTTEPTTQRETTTKRPETTEKVTEKPTEKQTQKQPASEKKYVLNTNTKKYHNPNCRYVDQIDPENYQEVTSVPSGYEPCAVCHPDR
mgnify:CR=1 FL=1